MKPSITMDLAAIVGPLIGLVVVVVAYCMVINTYEFFVKLNIPAIIIELN